MPAVLRAYGKDFDVDAFLTDSTLPVCTVKRIGEPVAPASQPDGACAHFLASKPLLWISVSRGATSQCSVIACQRN